MKITKEVQAQARQLMRLCLGENGLLQEETVRLVAEKLRQEQPRNYLELLTAFTKLIRLEEARHTATITSAVPLTPEEQARIRAKLDARHPGLRYEWRVEPGLIAGMTVRVGDEVTDASVRSRIERLSRIS